MKNYLKTLSLVCMAILLSNCTDEEDTNLPEMAPAIYTETFTRPEGQPEFSFENWTLFAQAGGENWFKNDFDDNDYIEFSSFNSGDPSNIAWAISPAINIDPAIKKRMIFQSAQHHATSLENKFEVLVSNDFDGTNVLAATWTLKSFRLPTYTNGTNYDFVNSGAIDLSEYSGNIYVAFRVTGDGLTNSDVDGAFQVDNFIIF